MRSSFFPSRIRPIGLGLLLGLVAVCLSILISRANFSAAQAQIAPTIISPNATSVPSTGGSLDVQPICPPVPYLQPGNPPSLPQSGAPQAQPIYPCPPGNPPAPIFNGVVIQTYQVQATIADQIAVTHITLTLSNPGRSIAQGANIFPLPAGAAVTDLTLAIDGQPIQGQIMDTDQARGIYEQTVRQLRDPALLQYVGDRAIQVQIFPIAPGGSRTVTLQYTQLLNGDNGLLDYSYPLRIGAFSPSPIQHLSVSVALNTTHAIGTIYAPDSAIVVAQPDSTHAQAGYEQENVIPNADFQLFYSIQDASSAGAIPTSVLTYRPDPTQDGYFMLLFTPSLAANAKPIPKDVILILDQSGSMMGQKWSQAQAAAIFVLRHLNPEDRFAALTFSTGYRLFNSQLLASDQAEQAVTWIQNQHAQGGTDINSALLKGLSLADPSRQTTILFMTDGLPTEGETRLDTILHNVQASAGSNVRIFNFGVGDDVNTYLLDSLAANQHGTTTYVHPNEDLEAAISTLYGKVSAPVLTNLALTYGSLTISDQYPIDPLPDLYAGQQLIIAGRYNGSGLATITVNGQRAGQAQTFTLPAFNFPNQNAAQPFVASLWATRKIGYLLQQIRLHGQNAELVSEVEQLSLQYGILTPYTAYLVQEHNPIAVSGGQNGSVQPTQGSIGLVPQSGQPGSVPNVQPLSAAPQDQTGAGAVNSAQMLSGLAGANAPATSAPTGKSSGGTPGGSGGGSTPQTQTVDGKTFVLQGGVWVDTAYLAAKNAGTTLTAQSIAFGSDAYFTFLGAHPELTHALALGTRMIILTGSTAVTITD